MNKNKLPIILILTLIALSSVLPKIIIAQTTNYSVVFDWTSNNYAPLDYRLKTRQSITTGSEIEIWANLFKTTISKNQLLYTSQNSKNFYYQWFSNGIKFKEGTGLSKINYNLDRYIKISSFSIEVRIYDDSQLIADEVINFKLTDPKIVVYQAKDEISKVAVSTIDANKNDQLKFKAIPYNFTVPSKDLIDFNWYHNNKKIDNNSDTLEIKLPDIETKGTFSVTARNSNTSLEKASYVFQINIK